MCYNIATTKTKDWGGHIGPYTNEIFDWEQNYMSLLVNLETDTLYTWNDVHRLMRELKVGIGGGAQ